MKRYNHINLRKLLEQKNIFIALMFLFFVIVLSNNVKASSLKCVHVYSSIDLDRLKPIDLKNFFSISTREGTGWSELKWGFIEEQKVFIKIIDFKKRDPDAYINEAYIAQKLQKYSFVPRFYGLVELTDGRLALIYEFIPSVLQIPAMTVNKKILPFLEAHHEQILFEIEKILKILEKESITPGDFQFLITGDLKVKLIDFEAYQLGKSNDDISFMNQWYMKKIKKWIYFMIGKPPDDSSFLFFGNK